MSWVNTNGPKPTFGVSDAAAGFDLHARTLGRHGYRASTSARATRHLRPRKSFGLLRPTTNSLLRCTTAAPTRAFGRAQRPHPNGQPDLRPATTAAPATDALCAEPACAHQPNPCQVARPGHAIEGTASFVI